MFQMGDGVKRPVAAARPKAARKPAKVAVTVKLEPRQREKLQQLGGDAWIREQIDQAKATQPDE